MTDLQYERWKDFAMRMAKVCFPELRQRPSKAWVLEVVEEFFDGLDEEYITSIVGWDDEPYPCDMVNEHLASERGYPPRCRACDWHGRALLRPVG